MFKILPLLFFLCVLFCVWESFIWQHPTWQALLPSPTRVFIRLYEGWDRFFLHSTATFNKILGGLAIALLVAFPLAWWMIHSELVRTWCQPLIVLMQGMPIFAIAPLMVLIFDWSYTAVVVPTALMIFFPLTVSVYCGFAATPQALLDYFRINKATSWQLLYHLRLPWAMPHVCSGLRICGAIAAMSAFTGEWAGAQEGLGVLMMETRHGGDLETAFAALFCLSAISMALYGCMAGFESWILSRRTSSSHQTRKTNALRAGLCASPALLLVTLSMLLGCASPPKDRPYRLMLDWTPNPNHIAIYAGLAKGFFHEAGVPIEIIKLNDPGDTFPHLASGQADIGINYMCHFLRNYHAHTSLIPVGYLVKEPLNALLFPKKLGIKTPQDLHGKIFGHPTDDLMGKSLGRLLQKQHIIPGGTRKVGFNLVAALASEKVDVLYGVYCNIEKQQLEAFGVETDSFTMKEFGMPHYFELLFLASKHSPIAQPAKMHAFKQAVQRSIDFSRQFPDEAFALYVAANPDKSPFAKQWEKESWKATLPLLAYHQEDEPTVWDGLMNWLFENRLIPSLIPLDTILEDGHVQSIASRTL